MSNDTATRTRPVFYCVAVKGANGRKWFKADTASCGDREFIQTICDSVIAEHGHTGLRFQVMDRDEAGDVAPLKYRPWDTSDDEGDEDVDLDALSDDEL